MSGIAPGVKDPPNAETLRLFVAVLLSDAWLAALAVMQDELRRAGVRLRYVRPDGIHLTLKFLGEGDRDRLDAIVTALGALEGAPGPFRLELGRAGSFGGARRPRVVWAGMNGNLADLSALQATVERALHPAGFPPEGRPFRAHLTLARVPLDLPAAEAARIMPALAALQTPLVQPFSVDSLALVQSELGRGPARYTVLQNWTLALPPG